MWDCLGCVANMYKMDGAKPALLTYAGEQVSHLVGQSFEVRGRFCHLLLWVLSADTNRT